MSGVHALDPWRPLHLGQLHGAEGFLVLLLALGPLLVAFGTVFWLRWQAERE